MMQNNLKIFNSNMLFNVNMLRNMSVLAKALKYNKFGEPVDVLQICEEKLDEPKDKQVLVKILAAPINPSDVLTIQNKYAMKPKFPAIGGNECVAEVISIGASVSKVSTGQRVVPFAAGQGTWRTHAIYNEEQLMPISDKLNLALAATILVNPCTAYRMLKDFVQLKEGDCIIQNGANSAVGQAVHQLCKAWNIKSVGIVRDRPDIANLKKHLKNLGATEILTDKELRTTKVFKEQHLPKPCLAFDCVGGPNATELARHLDRQGIMVIYGSMSEEPVVIPAAALIFKDIAFRGFWISPWYKKNSNTPEAGKMFAELTKMMMNGRFLEPVHEMMPMEDFKEAMQATSNFKSFTGKKILFNFQ